MTPQPIKLRTVYTSSQFAAEIMGGNVTRRWVEDRVREKTIRSVAFRPVLIPCGEAARLLGAAQPQTTVGK